VQIQFQRKILHAIQLFLIPTAFLILVSKFVMSGDEFRSVFSLYPSTAVILIALALSITFFIEGWLNRSDGPQINQAHRFAYATGTPKSSLAFIVFGGITTAIMIVSHLRGGDVRFFIGLDGAYQIHLNEYAHKYGSVWSQPPNVLQGLGGNTAYQYHYLLDPGYWIIHLIPNLGLPLAISFWIISLSISVYFLCTGLKFSINQSLITAFATPFIVLGSFSYTFSLIPLLTPHIVFSIAILTLSLSLITRFQYFTQTQAAAGALAINFLIAFLISLNPTFSILFLPIIFFYVLILLVFSRKSSIGFPTTLLLVGLSLILQAFLWMNFLRGTYLFTAAFVYEDSFQPLDALYKHASSILNWERKPAIAIYFIAILNALAYCRKRNEPVANSKLAPIAFLVTSSLYLIYGALWLSIPELRKAIRPVYLEFFLWPLIIVFFFNAVFLVCKFLSQILKLESIRFAPTFLFVIIFINFATFATFPSQSTQAPSKEAEKFFSYLEPLSLDKKKDFQGRVAIFTEDPTRQVQVNKRLVETFGTDFQNLAFWKRSIPTLSEYGQLITPVSFKILNSGLISPERMQIRNWVDLDVFDSSLLRYLGVNFVVSFSPMESTDLQLVYVARSPQSRVFLYRIENPTLGITSFEDLESRHLPKNYLFSQDQRWQPAKNISLTVTANGYRLRATSQGISAIRLPIEFSYCFSSSRNVDLIPIDHGLLGVIFAREIDAEILYSNSPFKNRDCRYRNMALVGQ